MDRSKYGRLLSRVTPTAIESEAQNERLLSVIEDLMAKGESKLSPEEDALIELLTQLVENFEKRAYPRKKSDPAQLVRFLFVGFLLDQRGLKPADLAAVVGSRGRVSDILSGRRSISKEQAKRLDRFFHVSPLLKSQIRRERPQPVAAFVVPVRHRPQAGRCVSFRDVYEAPAA